MAWIESTTTTDTGPALICINLDHVRFLRPTADGRTRVVFAGTPAYQQTLDDTYVDITSRVGQVK